MSALPPPRTTFFPPRSRYPPLVRCACVGSVPFLVGEGQMELPLRHRRQHRLTFGRRAQGGDEPATQHHRREIGFEHEVLAESFHQDGELDRAAADAAVLRRKRQTEPTELGELRPESRGSSRHRSRRSSARCGSRIVRAETCRRSRARWRARRRIEGPRRFPKQNEEARQECDRHHRAVSFKHRSRPRLSQRASPRTRFTGPCHSIPRGP